MNQIKSRKIIGVIIGLIVFALLNSLGAIGMILGLICGIAAYKLITGEKIKSFTLTK